MEKGIRLVCQNYTIVKKSNGENLIKKIEEFKSIIIHTNKIDKMMDKRKS
jgi:hypothetical protein